jgi:hypothetical protein
MKRMSTPILSCRTPGWPCLLIYVDDKQVAFRAWDNCNAGTRHRLNALRRLAVSLEMQLPKCLHLLTGRYPFMWIVS